MAERDNVPPVQRIRDVLAVRVRYRSLRAMAGEVGMSPSGLRKFLDGSEPYSATRAKLERWYVREALAAEEPSGASATLALAALVSGLPPRTASVAERRIVGVLEDVYKDGPDGVPEWLRRLKGMDPS